MTSKDSPINVILIGRHSWRFPPEREELDLPGIRGLVERLRGRGFALVLGPGRSWLLRRANSITVCYLPASVGRLSFVVRSLVQSRRVLRSWHGTTVVVGSDVWGAVVGLLLRVLGHRPLVVQVQGDVLKPGPEYGSAAKRWILGGVMRVAVRQADGVRCVNPSLENYVMALRPKGRVATIGTRVDGSMFTPSPMAKTRGRQPRTVISVGSLVPLKNHATLIRAMPHVVDQYPNTSLMLVGEGPHRPSLERLVSDMHLDRTVRLVGSVPHSSVAAMLNRADIFALPSVSEGQPRALLEAMACGLPVVASAIPSLEDIVRDGETGLLVDPNDSQAWSDALKRLLGDRSLRHRLGMAARTAVVSEHDPDQLLDRFAELLRGVVVE